MNGWNKRRAVLGATVMGWFLAVGAAGAAEVRAAAGMVYDDNMFEAPGDPQGGWISRFYFSCSGVPLKRPGGSVKLRYDGGLKRFWKSERSISGKFSTVLVNHLNVMGSSRVGRQNRVLGTGVLKMKRVDRVPEEEGYLRGALEGRIQRFFGQGVTGDLFYRFAEDDYRNIRLPDVFSSEAGGVVHYGKSRRFQMRLAGAFRWSEYSRRALYVGAGGEVGESETEQSDLLREVSAGLQIYRGMLVEFTYGFLHNTSNSFGYDFKAHRLRALLVRHLGWDLDAQMIANLQVRRYHDPLLLLPGRGSEENEYEQTLLVLKLSRQLSSRLDLSLQYGFVRNGARRSGSFYRKHTYAVSVEISL